MKKFEENWVSHLDCTIRTEDASKVIATVNQNGAFLSDEERSTLKLIASAPEMYRLLSSIDDSIRTSGSHEELANSVVSLCHNINQLIKNI